MRGLKVLASVLAVLILCSASAFGTLNWMKTFGNTYKAPAKSELIKAKCLTCHKEKTGKTGQNSYGKMLEKKKIEATSLKAIEKKDADKDGFTNIDEIKAGTLPGDAKSKPKK